jgi:hypothetical protein
MKMPIRREKWWVITLQVPLRVMQCILRPLYAISLGVLDKHLARTYERRLRDNVRLALRFLFTEWRGRIVSNTGVPFPPGFNYAFVTVAVENALFRFIHGRGELDVVVAASSYAPAEWHDLTLILAAIHGVSPLERRRYHDLWQVAAELEPHMKTLIENLTVERFPEIRERLRIEVYAPESFLMRQWETDTNANLYGSSGPRGND